jgi:hypothetical protein
VTLDVVTRANHDEQIVRVARRPDQARVLSPASVGLRHPDDVTCQGPGDDGGLGRVVLPDEEEVVTGKTLLLGRELENLREEGAHEAFDGIGRRSGHGGGCGRAAVGVERARQRESSAYGFE